MSKSKLDKMAEIVKGTPVYGVLPGSVSSRIGIKQGDMIISVNGMDTPTIDEYMEAVKLDKENIRRCEVWREGVVLKFEMKLGERIEEKKLSKLVEESGVGDFLKDDSGEKVLN